MATIRTRSDEQAVKEYTEFEELVKRTVFLGDISPNVTSAVITKALNQFGDVIKVEFIPNYTIPYQIPQCALVEMKNPKQAASVITEVTNYPFMMSGMPRPVRALKAEADMFVDRPSKPGTEIQVRWVEPTDPEFEAGLQQKRLYRKHATENMALTELTIAEEERLSKQQTAALEANMKKYELTEKFKTSGNASRIARAYGVRLQDLD